MPEPRPIPAGLVRASLRDLVLPMGLRVDLVEIVGQNLEIRQEPFEFKIENPATLDVHVTEAALAEFLNAAAPAGIRGFEVRIKPAGIEVEATAKLLMEVRVLAVCTLTVKDQTALYVKLESAEVLSGLKGISPRSLIESRLQDLNPILDATQFPVAATIDSVSLEVGLLRLQGSVAPK